MQGLILVLTPVSPGVFMEPHRRAQAKKDVQVAFLEGSAVMDDAADLSANPVPSRKKDSPGKPSGPWVSSSWDLLRGCEVTEISDSVPDGLIEELFQPHADTAKKPGK
jgi:hypothetical protein